MILQLWRKTGLLLTALGGVLLVSQLSPMAKAHSTTKKISGTFIQYQSWMMQLDAKRWIPELDSIKNAGMDTIVIQWVKADQARFYPVHVQGNDPTEIILSYADQHQMKVHLGLQFDRGWWTKWDEEDFLGRVAKNNIQFGKRLWKRYGKHPSFAGWYIPYEMSDTDFDEDEVQNLQRFIKTISTGLRKITPRRLPISLSSFFEGRIPPSAVQRIYTKILKGTGIDHLLIQDGVGVHNWSTQMEDKVAPYYSAYKKAAEKNGIQSWSVVENFTALKDAPAGSPNRAPTDINRLKEQLRVQSAHSEDKVVTFDFFHYMSPYRGEGQRQLYENYIQQIKNLP